MSFLFKICLGLFIFTVATHIAKWVQLSKYIERLSTSDDDIKGKTLKLHKLLVIIYKCLFWISPLYIIIIYIVHRLASNNTTYTVALIIMIYVLIIEDYFFRKKVLSKLDQ